MDWHLPADGRFTSDFGPRPAPVAGASTFHRGVDIAPPKPGQTGVDLVAAGPGVVIGVGTAAVRGMWVAVRHLDGTVTRYQHLASVAVQTKEKVTEGQRLGEMGDTGRVRGVHLHFETTPADADWTTAASAVDPEPFMVARGVDLRAATATLSLAPNKEPRMRVIANPEQPQRWITDGVTKRHIENESELPDLLRLCEQDELVVLGRFVTDRVPDYAPQLAAVGDRASAAAVADEIDRRARARLDV